MLLMTLLIIAFIVLFAWLYGFLRANDLSVPTKSVNDIAKAFRTVLIIFPHADDETISHGGLIAALIQHKVSLHWVILTRGERGNDTASYDEQLKATRTAEAQNVAGIYGITHLTQLDYPDNAVSEHAQQLKKELREIITETKPDLIITYDLAGLYGHPDHIITSELVTQLVTSEFTQIKLWYVSHPQRVLDSLPLPEHMAKDKHFKEHRAAPTHKVWIGFDGVLYKVRALQAYKSQYASFVRSFPFRWVPLPFYISLMPLEYFHEVN
jgi:LmbE family N-acetylglucosaminyl deacetylase